VCQWLDLVARSANKKKTKLAKSVILQKSVSFANCKNRKTKMILLLQQQQQQQQPKCGFHE
jgi:hypothetical protein